jgi:Spy/CpxP family protein refolding chaperone
MTLTKMTTLAGAIGLLLSVAPAWLEAADRTAGLAQAPQGGGPNPGRSGGRGGPSPDTRDGWWSDPEVKTALTLTEEQTRRIKEIFERREAEVKPIWERLSREGDRLDKMTRERVADEHTYAAQVSTVQNLFARLRETRTVMIYRMYRELQPEQYKKLEEIMDRRRTTTGRGSGPR